MADSTSHLFTPTGVQDMTWFSADYVYYIFSFLVFSEVSIFIMKRFLPKHHGFSAFSLRVQRNMAVYVLEVVVTFVLFILTVSSGMELIAGKGSSHDLIIARTNLSLLIALYLFELCYRPDMNWQLTLHHIITIALCIIIVQSTIDTSDKRFIACGLVMSFTATTEQLCFVSLFLYRLKHRYAGVLMRIAAIQSIAFKFLAIVGLYIVAIQAVWTDKNIKLFPSHGWFIALRVVLLTIVPALVFTQVYGAYILWKISYRAKGPQKADIRKSLELESAKEQPIPLSRSPSHSFPSSRRLSKRVSFIFPAHKSEGTKHISLRQSLSLLPHVDLKRTI